MDINEISGVQSDVPSESTLESEIDALSKIITDTKDDVHKFDDNDEDFKLDSNDISFTDGLQGQSAESNKYELLPDDGLAINDILDGSKELENFISTPNVDSDLQEVLGEPFETIGDLTNKINHNLSEEQTTDQSNVETTVSTESLCNVSLINANNDAQRFQSHSETSESLTEIDTEANQQPTEKIENRIADIQVDPELTDCLSEFMKKDDSQNFINEKLDLVEESDLENLVTQSSENKCIDEPDFTHVLNFPSVNPDESGTIFDGPIEQNLEKDSVIMTQNQQKESSIENQNIPAVEIIDCAKETNVHKTNNDTSIIQQDESEEIQTLSNKIDFTEDNNSSIIEDCVEEILKNKEINDEKAIHENFKPIDEPNVIDEMPTNIQLEKVENIENVLINCQSANVIEESIDQQNFNEDKNENDVLSEVIEDDKLIGTCEIKQKLETADKELKNIESEYLKCENDLMPSCTTENKIEELEEAKDNELLQDVCNDQKISEISSNSSNEILNSQSSKTIFEQTLDVNLEKEVPEILEKVESEVPQINIVENNEGTNLNENKSQVDIKLSEEEEECSSLIPQDLAEDVVTLNDPLSDNIENPKSAETKEISDPVVIPSMNQEMAEMSSSEQDSDSQGLISNIFNQVEKDLNSALNKLLETKENTNENINNFDNSELLNSEDENLQPLDEKSLDPLSILDVIPDQIGNEKLVSTEKEDITFEESSQSPTPMQSDKFINDLYNSCMPDDTTQNSNVEVENIKETSAMTVNEQFSKSDTEQDLENSKPRLETENQQLIETDALESATEFIFEDNQTANQPLTEISELESAVKFLQESEEQTTDSSQMMLTNEGNSSIFVSVEESECDNASELASDLLEVTPDPIAISEAEIISEAAKLENERKEKLELEKLQNLHQEASDSQDVDKTNLSALPPTENLSSDIEPIVASKEAPETTAQHTLQIPLSLETKLTPESLPKAEALDNNCKEPPTIEIPEVSKLVELPKSTLLIQKPRLDSPDRQTSISEPKISETPTKKDNSDRQQQPQTQVTECENVGSPRIILKIAKSAITECSEPRSPKSPKVRSSDSPNPDDSPSSQKLGKIKLKLSKGGHPSIIPSDDSHQEDTWHTDCTTSSLSPIGMKIKITKTTDAYEESQKPEETKDKAVHKVDEMKKQESPLGMKIKLSKTGDASIIQQDAKDNTQETTAGKKQDSPSLGMKIKLSKSGDASIIQQDKLEHVDEISVKAKDKHVEDDCTKRTESPIGMKIKLSKSGDASVICSDPLESAKETLEEPIKRTDSPIGVKIKLAKNKGGSASIISTDSVEEIAESSTAKTGIGMKIKLSKSGDASVIHTTKDDIHETTEHIGMKIKLSKTGEPSIIPSEFSREYEDITHKTKYFKQKDHGTVGQRSKDDSHLEMKMKLSKTGHPTIVTPTESSLDSLKTFKTSSATSTKSHTDIISFKKSHSDITIEPIKSQAPDNAMVDLHNKRKEITIAPVEAKKPKVDAGTKQMLPDITIQPIVSKKEHQQPQKLVLESNVGSISRQQMNVINQEISITQVCSLAPSDSLMGEHLKNALNVPTEGSTPSSSDCEIIEAQPELIIVNENSNSSQDVMIIDEVPPVKTPKKRGRPRRNALPPISTIQSLEPSIDPLSLDQPAMHMQLAKMPLQMQTAMLQQVPPQHIVPPAGDGIERPRRTCRSQKSYAPPKRGRGRGRGKRKNEALDIPVKKSRVEEEFIGIEQTAKPVIALQKLPLDASSSLKNSPELFRALNQPTLNQISQQTHNVEIPEVPEHAKALSECEVIEIPKSKAAQIQESGMEMIKIPSHSQMPSMHISSDVQMAQASMQDTSSRQEEQRTNDKSAMIIDVSREDERKQSEIIADQVEPIQSNQNWLAPSIKKVSGEPPSKSETISSLTVIDEETRMSAESGSRSQTPARNMSAPGALETLVNEESQNSVLSTATTESERVKQPKNRRMEISFDPDEGPFTVEKIAEYEWPAADKSCELKPVGSRGETFMIQEQISQYLGVKSFKRKYPDLKRRMVDMEERNFLRENALVSESMCDMGLTAVSSSEVLDIMCSDFPEQYEEYRKHMREKAAKEHSKKQKELSAAANAERNRIDLAEMAMQSTLSWNSGFNKARQESRRCSLDLQTFTVHMPRRPPKYDPARRGCNYPCALLTGQYTDYFRDYKPAELRYYPLNTVVYGPTRPNERKFDSQSEGSQSDSDSDSSSDDSSSTSSEGTQDTEGSQSTMDEVDMELAPDPSIKCKMCSNHLNKNNRPETLIVCGTCNGNVHPSCIDLTLDMVPHIRAYAWQCTDCKTCAQCHDPADEDKMLFCDMCDRGYHIYCVGLRRVPQGRWHCQECAVCANCGSKEPGGANSDRNSVAQWQHEFKKGDKNTRVYVSTFCVPCSKLWRKGRYCPHCSRCHNAPRLDQEPNLVHCGACDKYLHLECVETKGVTIDKRNYLCEFCSPNRQHLVKPLTSKTFRT